MKNHFQPKFFYKILALSTVSLFLSATLRGQDRISEEYVRIIDPFSGQNTYAKAHVVKQGESLYQIARRYKISVQDIKTLNNLRTNIIHPEDRLAISFPVAEAESEFVKRKLPVQVATPARQSGSEEFLSGINAIRLYQYSSEETDNPFSVDEATYYTPQLTKLNKRRQQEDLMASRGSVIRRTASTSPLSPQADAGRRLADRGFQANSATNEQASAARRTATRALAPASAVKKSPTPPSRRVYHEVQPGENIYLIAEKYGMSVEELRESSGAYAVRSGQTLVINPSRDLDSRNQHLASSNRRLRNTTPEMEEEFVLEEPLYTSLDVLNEPRSAMNLAALNETPGRTKARGGLDSFEKSPPSDLSSTRNRGISPANSPVPPASLLKRGNKSLTLGTIMEQGKYGKYLDSNLKNQPFYASHKQLPIGSKVRIPIPNNAGYIEVTIVDRLSPTSSTIIGLSPASLQLLRNAGVGNTITFFYD